MEKLNLTLTQGYPAHSSDTSELSRDQIIKVPYTQVVCCALRKERPSWLKVKYRPNELAKLNSSFTGIAR